MRIVFNRLGLKPLLVLLLTTLVLYKIQNAGFGSLSERGREEIEWLRTTKANLYRDKAKDGMNSSESLTENWRAAIKNLTRRCELWKKQTNKLLEEMEMDFPTDQPKFYLTAVLFVRIYEHDKANLTTRDLLQWIRYYLYIGVEHIYIYDSYVIEREGQMEDLTEYIKSGIITYLDWHEKNPYTMEIQVEAYQDAIDRYKHDTVWQMALDMDEYPYSPVDTDPGFLARFVSEFEQRNEGLSEITLSNYLVLGERDLSKSWFIEQIFRETNKEANKLAKPIYIPKNVKAQLHHNHLISGSSKNLPGNEIRFKHYWGGRLQDWGPDTQEVLGQTTPEFGILGISYALKYCFVPSLPYPF